MASLQVRKNLQYVSMLTRRYFRSPNRYLASGNELISQKKDLFGTSSGRSSPAQGSPTFGQFSAGRSFATAQASTGGDKFVDSEISKKPVVVFSLSTCPACARAKEILGKYKLSSDVYATHDLDKHNNQYPILEYLKKKTGAHTLPRIFINGKSIGGADDLARLEQNGELSKLLKSITEKQGRK